jgi:hypothetical protein
VKVTKFITVGAILVKRNMRFTGRAAGLTARREGSSGKP